MIDYIGLVIGLIGVASAALAAVYADEQATAIWAGVAAVWAIAFTIKSFECL